MGWLKHLIAVGLVLYPAILYFLHDSVPAYVFVATVLALTGLRLTFSNDAGGVWRYPLLFVLFGLVGFTLLDLELATRAYPALMAFGFAVLFGYTLLQPPTLVERLSRLREPELPPEGVAYCRNVTIVWALFCLVNGVVATATALLGSWELWSLWTGVISYVGMGILFVGETMLRKRLRRARG